MAEKQSTNLKIEGDDYEALKVLAEKYAKTSQGRWLKRVNSRPHALAGLIFERGMDALDEELGPDAGAGE